MNSDSEEEVVFTRKKKYIVESDEEDIPESSSCTAIDSTSENSCKRLSLNDTSDKNDSGQNHEKLSNVNLDTNNTSPSEINLGLVDACKSVQYSTSKDNKNSGTPKKSWYKNSDLFEDESSGEDEDSKLVNNDFIGDKSDTDDPEPAFSPLVEKKTSWYKNSDLFEDDSSGDEENKKCEEKNTTDGEQSETDDRSVPVHSSEKKERKSKTKAQNEIQDIRRESQRKMREAPTSLPYHRPRPRTLAEFLNRKKAPTTIPLLHTSEDVLRSAWKAIEEREKEVETFYKSESSDEESQHEEDKSASNDQKTETNELTNDHLEKSSINCHEDTVLTAEKAKHEDDENTTEGDDENKSRDTILPHSAVVDLENLAFKTTNENYSSNIEQISHSNEIRTGPEHLGTGEAKLNKNDAENIKTIELNSQIYESKQEVVLTESNGILVKSNNLDLENDTSNISKHSNNATLSEQEGSEEINVTENKLLDKNITSNLVNTEEFSLRYSESQGEQLDLVPNVMKTDMGELNNSEELESNRSLDTIIKVNNEDKLIEEVLIDNVLNGKDREMLMSVLNGNGETIEKNSLCEVESIEDKLIKKYKNYLKQPISSFPKLSGTHETTIDLDEEINKPGLNGLLDRFMKHLSYKKKPVKKKKPVEISIVSAETDSSGQVNGIHKETVRVLVGEEEDGEEDPALARPGAKMTRLKAQLQLEMGRKREIEWARKQQEQRLYEQEILDEEKEASDEDEITNTDKKGFEKEAQCSEGDDEESEEEDDEDIEAEEDGKEKPPKKKSVFVDDEAEESDDGYEENDEEDCSDSFIKKPSKSKEILRQSTKDIFLSQELLQHSAHDQIYDDEMTSFQKPLPPGEKEDETDDLTSQSSVCQSPAFRLTALEGKDINSFNWSEPTTPCKDLISPKTVTPVRARIAHMVDKSPLIGSQDLENLCSGQFVSQIEHQMTPAGDEDNSQEDFQLFLDDSEQMETPKKASLLVRTCKSNSDEKSTMMCFLEDGYVDDDENISTKVNNKKVKRLNFSDDEEEDESNRKLAPEESEVEENLEDSEPEENEEVGEVEYDSEENEVVRTAGEFLEKEAELSEEDWESEDEDERGLDTLEMEEADRENIDQRRVQRELEKLHMKQTLAEDKMKVRLLQERFLEDGELHTEAKRQRLFRWSNNAFDEDDNKAQIDSDGEKDDDDEDEENWRRSRHEREQYLIEHKNKFEKMDLEIEESDSQLLKLGHKALKRLNSKDQDKDQGPPVANIASPNPKQPYQVTVTRGSFLSRGDQVLSRLARITTASEGPINQPKNSRNFVFTSISPTKDSDADVQPLQQSKKRKIPPMVMPMPKRPCAQQPKTANKKSLFEALAKVKS